MHRNPDPLPEHFVLRFKPYGKKKRRLINRNIVVNPKFYFVYTRIIGGLHHIDPLALLNSFSLIKKNANG